MADAPAGRAAAGGCASTSRSPRSTARPVEPARGRTARRAAAHGARVRRDGDPGGRFGGRRARRRLRRGLPRRRDARPAADPAVRTAPGDHRRARLGPAAQRAAASGGLDGRTGRVRWGRPGSRRTDALHPGAGRAGADRPRAGGRGGVSNALVALGSAAAAGVGDRALARTPRAGRLGRAATFPRRERLPAASTRCSRRWARRRGSTRPRSLEPGGCVVVAGRRRVGTPPRCSRTCSFKQLRVLGSTMGTREEFERLLQFCDTAGLAPEVASVHALADARGAFARWSPPRPSARSSSGSEAGVHRRHVLPASPVDVTAVVSGTPAWGTTQSVVHSSQRRCSQRAARSASGPPPGGRQVAGQLVAEPGEVGLELVQSAVQAAGSTANNAARSCAGTSRPVTSSRRRPGRDPPGSVRRRHRPQAAQIHATTREFSPNPGHRNRPSSPRRNQFTPNTAGGCDNRPPCRASARSSRPCRTRRTAASRTGRAAAARPSPRPRGLLAGDRRPQEHPGPSSPDLGHQRDVRAAAAAEQNTASTTTPCVVELAAIDGHCDADTVNRAFGCAAGFPEAGVQSRPCQSRRCSGTSSVIPSPPHVPSSVSATLVKMTSRSSICMAVGFVDQPVPGPRRRTRPRG